MKYSLLTALFTMMSLVPGQAQELTADDIRQIRQKALRHVRQFEALLNLIAQPDEYLRGNNLDDLIKGYYQASSAYQIFRDSLVMVENDLNPLVQPQDNSTVPIKEYLVSFYSVYEKSPVVSVFFNNYEVSSVRQGESTYVEVYYTSEFTSHHTSYPQQPYPFRQKRVIVQAQQQATDWEVLITSISNHLPESTSARTVTNTFTQMPRVYRPGKTYSLPIRINTDTPPTSLSLYRNDEQVEDLSDVLADRNLRWQVPKRIDRGSGYRLLLYDSAAQKTIESSSFTIRRGFP